MTLELPPAPLLRRLSQAGRHGDGISVTTAETLHVMGGGGVRIF